MVSDLFYLSYLVLTHLFWSFVLVQQVSLSWIINAMNIRQWVPKLMQNVDAR